MERLERGVHAIMFACVGDLALLAIELSTGVFSGIKLLVGLWWLAVAALLVAAIAIYGYNGGYEYASGRRRIGRPHLPRLRIPLRMAWPQARYKRQYRTEAVVWTVEEVE